MTKTVLYTYLGTNGTITSTVHLEDIYYIRKYRLVSLSVGDGEWCQRFLLLSRIVCASASLMG